ncbi:DMT family transporter [Peribacillus simplex]|uniref:Amino-acid metabolite efflux pump n=1 Tax=Peribacillus simplex TaxID=1478 RepID=A0A9W4PIG6_9BACI|nr:EamA family transporter [Peribacillus simplex]CAH0314957.1 putative amino-acid metabolite efflux pump [Peribacillus simplex]
MKFKDLLVGILFTVLYASGAVVMKFGLHSAPPLTLSTIRFIIAGLLLLLYLYGFKKGKYAMPNKKEFKILFWLGLLNTSIFLGFGLLALRTVSSGIFNLFIPINPFLFALLAMIFMGQSIRLREWGGMVVSFIGLFVATYPSFAGSHSTIGGILLITFAMIAMAVGSLIYKKANLQLPTIVVNTWQVIIGGVILLIPTLILESGEPITIDIHFIGYLLWSVFALSIFNVNLWFYLLKKDAIKANNWLLLNPVAGYILGAMLLGEPITGYAVIGTIVVLLGLYLSGSFRVKPSN